MFWIISVLLFSVMSLEESQSWLWSVFGNVDYRLGVLSADDGPPRWKIECWQSRATCNNKFLSLSISIEQPVFKMCKGTISQSLQLRWHAKAPRWSSFPQNKITRVVERCIK
ncbi:uncharacterized protein BDW47DRAFT_101048 [Aspergillus candidus]|uniref:Uncharacterized protein n=1 Tax=Aspergillus candidus TaxID=41067 RepID=A0A2I2FIE4_ASPCN|nr:hypothetical protein BDW47DRAFT_101048 [Aspergillus candidus]PLB40401.1 hypothetical protein BDW47DRAFT_101048 [Aspergillus candidus]